MWLKRNLLLLLAFSYFAFAMLFAALNLVVDIQNTAFKNTEIQRIIFGEFFVSFVLCSGASFLVYLLCFLQRIWKTRVSFYISSVIISSLTVGFIFFFAELVYHAKLIYYDELYVSYWGQFDTFRLKFWHALAKSFILVNAVFFAYFIIRNNLNFSQLMLFTALCYSGLFAVFFFYIPHPLQSNLFNLFLLFVPIILMLLFGIYFIISRKNKKATII